MSWQREKKKERESGKEIEKEKRKRDEKSVTEVNLPWCLTEKRRYKKYSKLPICFSFLSFLSFLFSLLFPQNFITKTISVLEHWEILQYNHIIWLCYCIIIMLFMLKGKGAPVNAVFHKLGRGLLLLNIYRYFISYIYTYMGRMQKCGSITP